ncbi:MAG: hypothetical protein HZB14_09345 [Actinobacteria bacterium]|nr:hypothetical protein [Actinomycetota bacterium]
MTLRTLTLLAIYAAASTGGLVLLSRTLRGEDVSGVGDAVRLLGDPMVLLGAFLYIGSFACWLLILTRETVSTAYPIAIALTYTATIVASAVVLDESIGSLKLTGIAFVAVGAVIIATATT